MLRWIAPALLAPALVFAACSETKEPAGGPTAGALDASASTDGSLTHDGGAYSSGEDAAPADEAGKPLPPLFAFVGSNDGKIRTYTVDAKTGAWTAAKAVSTGGTPSFLAFDPPRHRVVAIEEEGATIRSFTFDSKTGSLTPVNTKSAGGAGTTHLSLDPTGKWVFVANYTAGSMGVFPIDAAGMLGSASDTRSPGKLAHWAGTDPAGTHVFVTALGTNIVAQYDFDSTTGKLTNNGTAAPPAGVGPRHLAFHPNEKWAYTMNELGISVTTYTYDKNAGTLVPIETISALPNNQDPEDVTGAEIFVHPSGKWVYGSTRGYDSIAVFDVDQTTGKLTLSANAPTNGDVPRSFGMDPEGTLLYAGNHGVGTVYGFRIESTGSLTPLGKTVDVTGPFFVGLARMP
jgi:6-phosphogluconolactonase